MMEADHIISVSKFKTHRYMNVTGPIKNLYGSVPGLTKFIYHSRFDNDLDFADLVVDVHLAARPSFHVVDAVDTIDGDGSRRGRVRRMKVIAAGADAFALESLMIELAGLEASDSRPLAAAIERAVCPASDVSWYTVLGDRVEDLRLSDFRLPGRNYFSERTPALLTGRLSRFTTVTPRPLEEKCTGCGTCAAVCPRGAIELRGGLARVDSSKCIRCFCCDELCEHQAIGMKEPVLLRLMGGR
jgi:ferredoxin